MQPADTHLPTASRRTDRQRGQVIVIFAGAMLLFAMLAAAVIDLSWYWTNNLRMQRAADAAALAGVVFLPGDPSSAISAARDEAGKNGYTHGTGGVVVTPVQDPTNNRRLVVTISGNVGTFFARVAGINSWPASRTSKSEFVLPVPMGSPENYYGVFGKVRTPGGGITTTDSTDGTTSYFDPVSSPGGNWTNPSRAYIQDSVSPPTQYATKSSTTDPYQVWGGFPTAVPSGGTLTINGVQVEVIARSADTSGCQLRVALNWTGQNSPTSGSWTPSKTLDLTGTFQPLVAGSPTDTWGETWSVSEISASNLRVRLEYRDPGANCTDGSEARVDHVHIRFHYTHTTSTFTPDSNLAGPGGQTLNPRGYWATMLLQGADDINGDAYLPKYETGSTTNPDYNPAKYYDYAVELGSGSSSGQVWIYDPVFCATSTNGNYGVGDRWWGGATPTSSFFQLWDTKNTPFDLTDDTRADPTGDDNLFRRIQASDTTLNGPAVGGSTQSCAAGATSSQTDGRYWHNKWWKLADGLAGNKTYRVRTMTTDPNSSSDQEGADGENSFAIWTTATGTAPKVYGVGAMQSFSPLPGAEISEFYLAQIDDVHAGKTVVISLWDPGDTGSLTGEISIRIPSSSGYSSATMQWSANKGTTNSNASNCNGTSGTGTIIPTHLSGSQRFNGCWVTIEIPIPISYSTAIAPPGEAEPGWWKIRYEMFGSASDTSQDVTTWQVSIRGNPVHLVLP